MMNNLRIAFAACSLSFCFAVPALGQTAAYTDFNNYTPVYCSGEIPQAFLLSAQEKYKQDVKEEAKTSKNKYVSKSKGEFLFHSNYFVDILLMSGKVMFGDSVTSYVNQVADRVLINEPELRGQLTFYCLRSEEPNAFSTDQGMIFVTVGLIAQLENEAQLAFILSHEIAHFQRRHTLNVYMEGQKIFSAGNKRRSMSLDDKIREFSNYEKDSEYEADSLGMARLAKTGYDCSEAMGAMFVLQFSHLPFDDYDFPVHSYERPMMAFPAELFLKEVKEIDLDGDNESDEYSSHPNMANRRDRLEHQYDELSAPGTEKFAGTEAQFNMVRNICRFEVIRLQMIARNYPTAIYNSTFLQKTFPNSLYLNRIIAKSLYCMAKYKNENEYNDGAENYGSVEGKQQACFHLFQKMNDEQLTAIALRTIYDISRQDSSPILLTMLNDLCAEAIYEYKMTWDAMNNSVALYNEMKNDSIKKDTIQVAVNEVKDTAAKKDESAYVSKYDKLRKDKKEKEKKELTQQKKAEKSKFHMLAFGDIINDPAVVALFKRSEKGAEERRVAKELKDKKYEGMSSYEERKARQKEEKADRAPAPLGIDTLLVVDPFYMYATDWQGYQLAESENGRYRLCDQVTEVARAANLEVVLFSVKEFTKDDIDKYNELALLNEWIEESVNHDDMVLIQSETEYAQPVCDKYNADNLMITGVVSVKQKREDRGWIIFCSIICYPILPIGLAYALTPEHETYLISGIYNVPNSTTQMARVTRLKAKARSGYIGSQLYDIFSGIQLSPEQKDKKIR